MENIPEERIPNPAGPPSGQPRLVAFWRPKSRCLQVVGLISKGGREWSQRWDFADLPTWTEDADASIVTHSPESEEALLNWYVRNLMCRGVAGGRMERSTYTRPWVPSRFILRLRTVREGATGTSSQPRFISVFGKMELTNRTGSSDLWSTLGLTSRIDYPPLPPASEGLLIPVGCFRSRPDFDNWCAHPVVPYTHPPPASAPLRPPQAAGSASSRASPALMTRTAGVARTNSTSLVASSTPKPQLCEFVAKQLLQLAIGRGDEETCSICTDAIDTHKLLAVGVCGHLFCASVAESQPRCPNCRTETGWTLVQNQEVKMVQE